jgi:hypothetical protein
MPHTSNAATTSITDLQQTKMTLNLNRFTLQDPISFPDPSYDMIPKSESDESTHARDAMMMRGNHVTISGGFFSSHHVAHSTGKTKNCIGKACVSGSIFHAFVAFRCIDPARLARRLRSRVWGRIVYLSFFLGRSWLVCPHFFLRCGLLAFVLVQDVR